MAVLVADALPAGAMPIGQLTATDCQQSANQPVPTQDTALTLLKAAAAKRGATLLTAVSYQAAPAGDPRKCYAAIVATGTAAQY